MWVLGNWFQANFPEMVLSTWFLCQLASWAPQIAAHRFIEGRSPALFDNLAQAFLLAPFFVFLEVLFFLGYRPQLKKDIDGESQKNIDAWKRSNSKKAQ